MEGIDEPKQEGNSSPLCGGRKRWFAMRATYRRSKNARELLDKEKIECFIPMRYETREIRGKKKRELTPVVQNLMFVHAIPSVIQEVKSRVKYLQYIVNVRSGEKIIVPEDQMRRFIAVTGTYDEQLLWFKPEEVNLAKGTRVRITGGVFEGEEGVFVKVRGARERRVVVEIQGVIAVAMATIHPDLIEPLPPGEKKQVANKGNYNSGKIMTSLHQEKQLKALLPSLLAIRPGVTDSQKGSVSDGYPNKSLSRGKRQEAAWSLCRGRPALRGYSL